MSGGRIVIKVKPSEADQLRERCAKIAAIEARYWGEIEDERLTTDCDRSHGRRFEYLLRHFDRPHPRTTPSRLRRTRKGCEPMSRFIRCDRCTTENAVIGTVSLPPGWQTICHADLCERCCEIVRDFIRFRPSDAEKLPVEPISLEVGPTDAPPDKLFETSPEEPCVMPADSSAAPTTDSQDAAVTGVPTPPAGTTSPTITTIATATKMSPTSPDDEASTEEKARTRKTRKRLMGQGAILPDPRKPQPGAPA